MSSPSGVPDHPYQFDATSLLPGFMATLALIACKGVDLVKLSDTFQRLNLFSTRRQLYVESWNMFATSTSRMAKLFVFILFCLNLGAIGFTVVSSSEPFPFLNVGTGCGGLRIPWDAPGLPRDDPAGPLHHRRLLHHLLWPGSLRLPIL